MIQPTLIETLDDPRVLPYRDVAHPSLLARAGLFVAEGRFVVARLLAQNRYRTHSLLLTQTAFDAVITGSGGPEGPPPPETFGAQGPPFQGAPIYVVNQSLMNQIVGFNIHRGCLALAERPPRQTLDQLPVGSLGRVLVLEGVNNPDNIGGLFRSAAAFDVDLVVLGPACGDPLYRKAIRTSMGATLQVPFVDARVWPDALDALRRSGMHVLALSTARDARPLDDLPRHAPRVALLVGNEGEGLSASALSVADDRIRIPMTSEMDSLNVSVAASIALYHFFAD